MLPYAFSDFKIETKNIVFIFAFLFEKHQMKNAYRTARKVEPELVFDPFLEKRKVIFLFGKIPLYFEKNNILIREIINLVPNF